MLRPGPAASHCNLDPGCAAAPLATHLSIILPWLVPTSTLWDAAVPHTSTLIKDRLVRVKLASSQVAPPFVVRQMLRGQGEGWQHNWPVHSATCWRMTTFGWGVAVPVARQQPACVQLRSTRPATHIPSALTCQSCQPCRKHSHPAWKWRTSRAGRAASWWLIAAPRWHRRLWS